MSKFATFDHVIHEYSKIRGVITGKRAKKPYTIRVLWDTEDNEDWYDPKVLQYATNKKTNKQTNKQFNHYICKTKIRYTNTKSATKAMEVLSEAYGSRFEYYRCGESNHYHLAKVDRSKKLKHSKRKLNKPKITRQ